MASESTAIPSNLKDIDADVPDLQNQLPPAPERPSHPNFNVILPPDDPVYGKWNVFLAGSIEMGNAIQWQKHMYKYLNHLPITLCNPRRGRWDPNVTGAAKDAAFNHQVTWELNALTKSDVVCFFFDTTTKSPVTMLELGLWAHSGKVVVCCGDTFWKAGNIHIVCERYNIPFVEKFEDLPALVVKMLGEKGLEEAAKETADKESKKTPEGKGDGSEKTKL